MNNSSSLKKNGLFTSPILRLYDKPRQHIVEYYLHWTQWWHQRGLGATALLSESASPPPLFVGENLYICQGKLTKLWPTVPNHEKKYSPPLGEHSPSVGKFLAPALTGTQRLISFSGSSDTNHGRLW